MSEIAIDVQNVSKKFRMHASRNQSLKSALLQRGNHAHNDFWALKDVSFQIPRGSTFGLVGSNGSGKSTLLKCLARILVPDTGGITSHGRVASLLEVGSGFHPELSGRENIYLNGSILGMSKREIDSKYDDIVDFSDIGQFIDQPVKNYSSGMYVRLGFSIAIHVQPDVLVVDEILAVGDAAFQQKCEQKFIDLKADGKTVVLVSHSLPTIQKMCDQAAWLEKGVLKEVGEIDEVLRAFSFGILPVDPVIQSYVSSHPDTEEAIGWPVTGATHFETNGGGIVQGFSEAAVLWTDNRNIRLLKAPIRHFYNNNGGVEGALGWPTGDMTVNGRGEFEQTFQFGTILVSSDGAGRVEQRRAPE